MNPLPRIAWLPGDGIGPEVLAAARIVLDAVGFQADYVECDIGWRFWRQARRARWSSWLWSGYCAPSRIKSRRSL